jgi:hypothetical protein
VPGKSNSTFRTLLSECAINPSPPILRWDAQTNLRSKFDVQLKAARNRLAIANSPYLSFLLSPPFIFWTQKKARPLNPLLLG